jgi:negative regulator of sigma-B (phosphoserine phosphatase)
MSNRGSTLVEWGVGTITMSGETQSGDHHLVKLVPDGALIAVVDGLGHGDAAALAAKRAIATIDEYPEENVIDLIMRCHQTLRKTRGAVISLAAISGRDRTLSWIGVGNVEGTLLRADTNISPNRESILMRGGVVGYNLPPLRASVIPIYRGDTLVLATDGIHADFMTAFRSGDAPQQVAERICRTCAKTTDDALVVVARYLGTGP